LVMRDSYEKLVIDIETSGQDWDSLDELSQEQLTNYFERNSKDAEEAEESKDKLGFWPLTGEVVAIGVLNPITGKGAVLAQGNGAELPSELEAGIALEWGSEADILKKFWNIADKYNYFITFNGRQFDAPYLMIRSAIHGIRPSKNLLANRYLSSQPFSALHVDLMDQLSFYGAARKNFSLHFWTQAFGIKSPKDGGVDGDDVKKLFRAGKILDIAKYNLGDLQATAALYDKWERYLSF